MVLGSREHGAEEKQFRELVRKVIFLSGSREQRHPPPWAGLIKRSNNILERLEHLYVIIIGIFWYLNFKLS